MQKVRTFYQNLYKKKISNTNYSEFLTNYPKISEASKEGANESELNFRRSVQPL
jgi:hypothetical protein